MKTIPLPARSPNLNAFAERWVRSAKQECLSNLILFGERPLLQTLAEFSAHFHGENHQGERYQTPFPELWPAHQQTILAPNTVRSAYPRLNSSQHAFRVRQTPSRIPPQSNSAHVPGSGVASLRSTPDSDVNVTPSGSEPRLSEPVWLKSHVESRQPTSRYAFRESVLTPAGTAKTP